MENVYIISLIVSAIGIITATGSNFTDHTNKKIKRLFAIIGGLIAIIGLLLSFIQKKKDDKDAEKKSVEQKLTINNLQIGMDTTKHMLQMEVYNSDSLKSAAHILTDQNNKLHKDIVEIKKQENEHFIRSQESMEDVSRKFGMRHLNIEAEKYLIKNLGKGSVTIQVSGESQEAIAFEEQMVGIFSKAGWKVSKVLGMTAMEVPSKDILVIYTEEGYVKYKNAITNLAGVFSLAGYKINFLLEKKLPLNVKDETGINFIIYPYTERLN